MPHTEASQKFALDHMLERSEISCTTGSNHRSSLLVDGGGQCGAWLGATSALVGRLKVGGSEKLVLTAGHSQVSRDDATFPASKSISGGRRRRREGFGQLKRRRASSK
jgi:hypothetical protein